MGYFPRCPKLLALTSKLGHSCWCAAAEWKPIVDCAGRGGRGKGDQFQKKSAVQDVPLIKPFPALGERAQLFRARRPAEWRRCLSFLGERGGGTLAEGWRRSDLCAAPLFGARLHPQQPLLPAGVDTRDDFQPASLALTLPDRGEDCSESGWLRRVQLVFSHANVRIDRVRSNQMT